MLEIKNLHAQVDGKKILNGINLTIKAGEVHAIMGPNGAGKSTLAKVIAGHPAFEVTEGQVSYEVNFKMKDLLAMEPDVRAKEGVFLAFQYPIEVPGISNSVFLQTALNAILEHHGSLAISEEDFNKLVVKKMELLSMNPKFLERSVNVGFSGGEKKRNEILQMAVLSPRIAFLDETDSGLDIDSLRIVSDGVNRLRTKDNSIVMVTHYQRLLDYIKPDFVHVLAEGKIVETGDAKLALKLEQKGYDWLL